MTIAEQQKALQNIQFTSDGLEAFLKTRGREEPATPPKEKLLPTSFSSTVIARQPISTDIDLDLFNVDESFVHYEPDEEISGAADDNDADLYQQQLGVTDDEYLDACRANKFRTNQQLVRAIAPKMTAEAIWQYYPDHKSKKKPKSLPRRKDILLGNLTREELCILIAKLDQRGGDLRNYSLFKPQERRKKKRFEDIFFEVK